MDASVNKGYSTSQGVLLLGELTNEGKFVFNSEDAKQVASKMGMSDNVLRVTLHNLVKSEWLMRIRRGLYVGTGKLPGASQVHPFVIATKLVTPSAISYWSALNFHGLTEQLPRNVTAMTTSKVVTPSMRSEPDEKKKSKKGKHTWEISGIRYEYAQVKPDYFFGIEDIWIDQNFRIPMTDKERTLMECFAWPRMFGGMGEALGITEEHLNELNMDRLIEYAIRYGKTSLIKRLGWSLEHLGVSKNKLKPLLAVPSSGYKILDPTKPKKGEYDPKWMLLNNLAAKDEIT
jgi:predicted transcriptional regulator of viral defense system